jgi:hypothetical protein
MPKLNRSLVTVGTASRTICRRTRQVAQRVADAVLVTHAVVLVGLLAVGARCLL